MENSFIQNPEPAPISKSGCSSLVVFTLVLLWVAFVSIVRITTVFTLSAAPSPNFRWTSLLLTAGQIFLIGIVVIPLAATWGDPRYRAIFRTWSLALGFGLLVLPVQLTPSSAAQSQAVLHILLGILFILILLFLARRSERAETLSQMDRLSNRSNLLPALLIAILLAYPWLAWGALGSLLDTFLELVAAMVFGLVAALLLEWFLFRLFLSSTLAHDSLHRWPYFILTTFATSTVLMLLASLTGFSFGGMQILLMLVWLALGGALVTLRYSGAGLSRNQNIWTSAILAGLAAASPMAFIDPDELALIISGSQGEIMQWALTAAGVTLAAAVVLGFLLFVIYLIRWRGTGQNTTQNSASRSSSLILSIALLAALLGAAWVYIQVGRPGFFGERLFVILKSQPDVSNASTMSDYNSRRRYVYTTLVENANSTQSGLRNALDRLHVAYTPYYLENSLEVRADPLFRLWLSTRPEVDRVLDSPHLRPLPELPPQMTGSANRPASPDWNLTMISADRVWNELGITGKGIVVGQSDSGADASHPELADSYRGKNGQNDYNWFDPWYGTTAPRDFGFHGTHTLASAVGNHVGVAPDATWYACVNLARNLGDPPLYLDCMQFMLAPFPLGGDPFRDGDPSKGAQVINNSWGCPDLEGCDPDALLPATQALRAAGVFVEASAGNDGPACATINSPLSLYGQAYTTGAIDRFGQLAGFSSRGPVTVDGSDRIKPDIVAPGQEVLSAMPQNTYGRLSGTSMAGPHVTGVVALMWSANPALIGNIDRTEQILDQTAKPFTGQVPACPESQNTPSTAYGYGVIDAYAAVQMAIKEK